MFKTLQTVYAKDADYPERQFRISMLRRALKGTLYDGLKHAFHDEKTPSDEYIPLRSRRPSVRYGLLSIVVSDSVSLLFSEGHFPEVDCDHESTREALETVKKETRLNEVMIDAATRGSVGSVCIMMRILRGRVFFEVMDTEFLTPMWETEAPDTLFKITEQYKTKGKALQAVGYDIDDQDAETSFWFRRDITSTEETFYLPWKADDKKAIPQRDAARSVSHNLGFVPAVWVKNLTGGDAIDGAATFPEEAIDTSIEIDYQLSQAGRGLKYSADPTLLIKEPTQGDGTMVKGGGNAILVSADGDAKMLEINGSAAEAVISYVETLRQLALETMHGNRTSADKISAAQSGRAMELMNQSLVWLADRLRISYGEGALKDLLCMVLRASKTRKLVDKRGKNLSGIDPEADISLRWPAWYQPTAADRQSIATTLKTHINAGVISPETATKTIAADYDIEDVDTERAAIAAATVEKLEQLQPKAQLKIND